MESFWLMTGQAQNSTTAHFCAGKNASYSHRVDDKDQYNWCPVEGKGWDVILFAGIAVVVASLSQGPYSSLIVLLAGGILMGFAYPFNLKELGNGLSLWLGIEPYELFFYIFLPPLLLDAALKIDWYVFKKVFINIVALAFFVVLVSTALLIPVMLYVYGLRFQGWYWYDAALFGSMIASTDAVAIVAVLKKSGPPERLRILLEGESLLNDASSITLFTIFIQFVIDAAQGRPSTATAAEIALTVLKQTAWLSAGGFLIGMAFGVCTRMILRKLQRFGATAEQQIALTLALAYLVFYTANAPCKVSGVIAVAVFGLYGAATSQFDISAKLEESGAFEDFWNSFAFVANGIVFFYAGASSVNFVVRSANNLAGIGRGAYLISAIWRAPLIWAGLNVLRFLVISAFRPLFRLGSTPMRWKDVLFCSTAGLRGSVSLIMAQAVVIEVPHNSNPIMQRVQSEVVMFTAVFVLLSLLIQAPLLPHILRWTTLDKVPMEHQIMRRKAVGLLLGGTHAAIEALQGDDEELMRGVDWQLVAKTVNMAPKLRLFINPQDIHGEDGPRGARVLNWLSALCCCWGGVRNPEGVDEEAGNWRGEDLQSPFDVNASEPFDGSGNGNGREMEPTEASAGAEEPLLSSASAPELTTTDTSTTTAAQHANGGNTAEVPALVDAAAYLGAVVGHSQTAVPQPQTTVVHEDEEDEPVLGASESADMRSRICAGMKRFFHTKSMEGLLSRAGLRMLDHCCDDQIDSPTQPLRLWSALEHHFQHDYVNLAVGWVVFRLRKVGIRLGASRFRWLRHCIGRPLYCTIDAGMRLLSKHTLLCSEVAMEYLLALTHSPGVRWLQEHRPSSVLVKEVRAESHAVWNFIVSLELESSDRFQAIQSYRATMAVLRQQLAFVDRLTHSGMLNETEADLMADPIDETMRALIHSGPQWQAPYVTDVLRSLPILRDMPRDFIKQLLLQGSLVSYAQGARIHEATPEEGILIVCHGTVRVVITPWTGIPQTHFLGCGGMFGLFTSLTGDSYKGRGYAIGEGSAMGRGPTVFRLPRIGVHRVRQRAAEGHPDFVQLEVDMFRLAALEVVERLQAGFLHEVCAALLTHHAQVDTSQADADAAAAAAAALAHAPSSRAPSTVGSFSVARRQKRQGKQKAASPWSLEPAFEQYPASNLKRQATAAAMVHEVRSARRKAAARRAKQQAEELYGELRDQISYARFMQLPAGREVPHLCTAIILKGSLVLKSSNPVAISSEASAAAKAEGSSKPETHSAPAVLPWVYDVGRGNEANDQDGNGQQEVSMEGTLTGGTAGATVVFAANDIDHLTHLLRLLSGELEDEVELRPLHIDPEGHQLRPPRSIEALQDYQA